jgi:hypothetical protein
MSAYCPASSITACGFSLGQWVVSTDGPFRGSEAGAAQTAVDRRAEAWVAGC